MSHHIIHDKQFIKVKDRFICMQLGGDNNLVDTYTGKTCRSWYPIKFNGTLFPTKEDILKDIARQYERVLNGDYSEDGYIWESGLRMGGRSTFSQYKAFYMTAIKKAITIEQLEGLNNLRTHGINIIYQHKYDDATLVKDGLIPFIMGVKSDNLDKVLDTYNANKGRYNWLTAKFTAGYEDLAKDIRKKYFPRNRKNANKELKRVDEFYTIMVGDRYFVRNLKYGYKYSDWSAHIKLPKKAAERKLKKLIERNPTRGYSLKKIEAPAHIYV
jgi:hypothetical protein